MTVTLEDIIRLTKRAHDSRDFQFLELHPHGLVLRQSRRVPGDLPVSAECQISWVDLASAADPENILSEALALNSRNIDALIRSRRGEPR